LKAEDVDVQTGGGRLTVCGRKREEGDERVGAYRVSERRFGQFERSFPIPADAESSRVDAAFRDGLLTVVLPKRAEAAGRAEHVQVKAARG
jgi:HSP20 family protein